jgi:hypothetical protein
MCVTMHFTLRESGHQDGRPGWPDNAVSKTNDVVIGQCDDCPQQSPPTTSGNDRAAAGELHRIGGRPDHAAERIGGWTGRAAERIGGRMGHVEKDQRATPKRVDGRTGHAAERIGE